MSQTPAANETQERPRFCVLGAGHGGTAMAAHLALMGFQTNLYNRSEERLIPIKPMGGIEAVDLETGWPLTEEQRVERILGCEPEVVDIFA